MRVIVSLLFFFMTACFSAATAEARDLLRIETGSAAVFCDPALKSSAMEIISLYPAVRADLETTFMWKIDFKPAIILIGDRNIFQQMASNRSFIAYAIPEKFLIVIDDTRMNQQPFNRKAILKHELCHLLLNRYVRSPAIPKWLDEGIAQWASEGIPDVIAPRRESMLTQAALSGRLYRFASLTDSFPPDEQGLILAYEQSRSIVDYIIENYGKNGVLNILEAMRKGASLQDAIQLSLMISLPVLETRWEKKQRGIMAVVSYFAVHIYTIIFIMAALLTFWAYIRFIIRRRRLRQEPEDDEDFSFPDSPDS